MQLFLIEKNSNKLFLLLVFRGKTLYSVMYDFVAQRSLGEA